MTSSAGITTYRQLLRTANIAFRNDTVARVAAWQKIREEYTNARSLSGEEADEKLQIARDTARILRSNVVQATQSLDQDGRTRFSLHLHEHSELGDNDSRLAFAGKGAKWDLKGGCGGSSSRQ